MLDYEPLISRNLHPLSRLKAVLENTCAEDTVVSEDHESDAEQSKTDSGSRKSRLQTTYKDEVTTERTELDGKSIEMQLMELRHRLKNYIKTTELGEDRPVDGRFKLNFLSKDPPISMVMKLEESGQASLPDSLLSSDRTVSEHCDSPSLTPAVESKSPPAHQMSLFSFCNPDEKQASVQSLCTSGEEEPRLDSLSPSPMFISSSQSASNFTLGKKGADQRSNSKGESLRSSLKGSLKVVSKAVKTQVAPLQEDAPPSLEVSMDQFQDWVPERTKHISLENALEVTREDTKAAKKRSIFQLICPCFGGKSAVRHR